MIRKLFAALLVGAAVVWLNQPDEAERVARDAASGAAGAVTERAGDALARRCRADPAVCLR